MKKIELWQLAMYLPYDLECIFLEYCPTDNLVCGYYSGTLKSVSTDETLRIDGFNDKLKLD